MRGTSEALCLDLFSRPDAPPGGFQLGIATQHPLAGTEQEAVHPLRVTIRYSCWLLSGPARAGAGTFAMALKCLAAVRVHPLVRVRLRSVFRTLDRIWNPLRSVFRTTGT